MCCCCGGGACSHLMCAAVLECDPADRFLCTQQPCWGTVEGEYLWFGLIAFFARNYYECCMYEIVRRRFVVCLSVCLRVWRLWRFAWFGPTAVLICMAENVDERVVPNRVSHTTHNWWLIGARASVLIGAQSSAAKHTAAQKIGHAREILENPACTAVAAAAAATKCVRRNRWKVIGVLYGVAYLMCMLNKLPWQCGNCLLLFVCISWMSYNRLQWIMNVNFSDVFFGVCVCGFVSIIRMHHKTCYKSGACPTNLSSCS